MFVTTADTAPCTDGDSCLRLCAVEMLHHLIETTMICLFALSRS